LQITKMCIFCIFFLNFEEDVNLQWTDIALGGSNCVAQNVIYFFVAEFRPTYHAPFIQACKDKERAWSGAYTRALKIKRHHPRYSLKVGWDSRYK
ncbi:MAG: hypothetical protein AB2693_28315, partial [Candidatus Thiodiazotropha sp.]